MGNSNMKNLLKIIFCVIFISQIISLYALSCVPLDKQRKDYKNAYLLKIVSIDKTPQKKPNYGTVSGVKNGKFQEWVELMDYHLTKKAQIEVLKIYKGNIKRISKLKSITITVACIEEEGWMGYDFCKNLEGAYPYQAGDKIVVFNNEDGIYSGPCSFADEIIKTSGDLRKFEQYYKPKWKKQTKKVL